MNFYEHQAQARRRTLQLGVIFFVAVVLIIVAINAAVFSLVGLGTAQSRVPVTLESWLQQPYWVLITALVVAVIAGNTLLTSLRLAGGGPALARMLGARRLTPGSGEIPEQRLANVVEEMSIASGVPVPTLYVLDEEAGINAFVAGSRPTEAIMVVTRGALDTLSRDELQGVVAHEYSHIFNHDMKLNIQLMGVLAGLFVIGQIGRLMLHSGRGGSRESGQLAVLGVAVIAIGYIGTLCGALIKAAISRQREFLADASAVQYTRDPHGIASALYRIKTHSGGSLLDNAHAEDISHFCFGESVHYFLGAVMATHPPLDERIRRVQPRFTPPSPRSAVAPEAVEAGAQMVPPTAVSAGAVGFAGGNTQVPAAGRRDGAAIAESVGTLTPAQVAYAQDLQSGLPSEIAQAFADADGAAQLMFALALNAANASDKPRLARLVGDGDEHYSAARIGALEVALAALPARSRLPLINMALPRLKMLLPEQRTAFLQLLGKLIAADRRFTYFEFVLQHILTDHLDAMAPRAQAVRFLSFTEVARPLRLLLSVLAHAGTRDEQRASQAYMLAWKPFGLGAAPLLARRECSAQQLHDALDDLAQLSPLLKRNVIRACADCVIHDFTINAAEGELLQAVAISLDCPLPPLVEH